MKYLSKDLQGRVYAVSIDEGKAEMTYYILDGREGREHKVIRAFSAEQWGVWFETHKEERIVDYDKVYDNVEVSTVFLGLDHSFGYGEKQLFETLVFGGSMDGTMRRYATWEEAEKGHKEMVKEVKKAREAGTKFNNRHL